MRVRPLLLWLILTGWLLAGQAIAAPDPAAAQIETLHAALLTVMKAGPALTVTERYRKLAPAIEPSFDFPAMTAFAVGPSWAGFSSEQQQALISAFTRLTVASYAHNFTSFDGQRFEIQPEVAVRGVDRIVQTHLVSPHSAPVALTYRMRESAGSWKIIDVYYGSISQLTTRRADFAAPLASGGAQGLITHLNALSDELLR